MYAVTSNSPADIASESAFWQPHADLPLSPRRLLVAVVASAEEAERAMNR
jgi:hypothetical protein